LEKFILKYENSKNPSESLLIKSIKDNLLKFKENDEEEKKRESNFTRKQQAFEKAKKLAGKTNCNEKSQNSDFYLINASDHMITRHQLNQITKTTSLNNFQTIVATPKHPMITEQDKLKMKIERERIERQKRLEKRQKIMEMTNYDEIIEEQSEKEEKEIYIRNKRVRPSQRSSQRNPSKRIRSKNFDTKI